MVVGHAHLVAGNGVGNGDGGMLRHAPTQPRQIGMRGQLQRGVIGTGQHLHRLQRQARASLPGKPGIGTAHIGNQAGTSGGVAGSGARRNSLSHGKWQKKYQVNGRQRQRERGIGPLCPCGVGPPKKRGGQSSD